MILGHSPFSGDDEDELFHSICNDKPYYPHSMNKEAVRLLEQVYINFLFLGDVLRLQMPCRGTHCVSSELLHGVCSGLLHGVCSG